METVQLQCGSCNKLMAISTAHLGGQVRCPHCQAVVQAPPRAPAAASPAASAASAASAPTEIMPPPIEVRESDSIFSPPEPSDDLFDAGPQRPLVQSPLELTPLPPPAPADDLATVDAHPPLHQNDITEALPAPHYHEAADAEIVEPEAPADAEPEAQLATLQRPRPTVDRGYLSLMLLIFLVPYSILMTLFVIYLWHQLSSQEHPLRMLPDPVKKDGARQVLRTAHDQPLADNQKVRLGDAITIGAIQVTPEKVTRDEGGALQLVLSVKNVSSDQAFSPMHQDFLLPPGNGKKKSTARPYTFVAARSSSARLYGHHCWFERGGEERMTSEGDLRPGEQEKLVVTAEANDAVAKRILESNEPLTWRVQVRRGLVHVDGHDVSATAVIGVQFNASQIQ